MWILFWVVLLACLISAAIAGYSAAPWLPTLPSQRKHLFDNLKLEPGQKIVDLGCGDASVLFEIARRYPNQICVGYEISFLPLALAWMRKLLYFRAYKNVSIRFGNLFKQDLQSYDVIFVFLLSRCYPKLLTSLKGKVAPHAKIIVEAWPLPGLTPSETIKAEGLLPIYIYTGQDFRA
jgi:precorrin-6B methylase 2